MPLRSIEDEDSWIKDSAPIAKKLHNLESSRDNILYFQAYQRLFFVGVTNSDHKKALTEFTAGFLPADGRVESIEPIQTLGLDSKVVEGADTQASSKEHLTSLLASQVSILETFANQILRDYAAFKVQDFDFQGKVTFNKNFTDEDLNELRDSFLTLKDDINRYPTWKKEILKKFAGSQELPEIEKILAEIDSGATTTDTQQVRGSILSRLAVQNGGN